MMRDRRYSLLDKLLIQVDAGLAAVFADQCGQRPSPAVEVEEAELSVSQQQEAARLMRVNHTGEICAQALYNGQMVVARSSKVKTMLQQAAAEETDHLAWTHQRIKELGGHRSYLNCFWYLNSWFIGIVAGLTGDRWSLGFVEETERQVGEHLQRHLNRLPAEDLKSRRIVEQMHRDELQHGQSAVEVGASQLPQIMQWIMALHGRVMTGVSYWI